MKITNDKPASRTQGSRQFNLTVWMFAALFLALWPALLSAQTNPLRFAWLSDTHIGSSTAEADLRAAVRDINSMTGLSFVVVSGDVTEYGSEKQLRLAKEILDGLRIPYHAIPGNHDTKWSESGATDFPRLWGADRFVFKAGGFCFVGMHEGPVMKMADGHWAPQDVRWLRETLKRECDAGQSLVFITHYPIDDSIDNWYVVLELLKQYNTQVVLCGHGHANKPLRFEGIPGVMGRSNLRARNPAGGFNLVEVREDQLVFCEHQTGHSTQPQWHRVPLEKHDYAGDTNQYPRPSFAINTQFPGVKEQWRFDAGHTIASTPALAGDVAVVGDASGMLNALDLKTGAIRWQFKTGNAVYSTPAVAKGAVVVASTDGTLYALQAGSGRELWRFKSERPMVASPAIANGMVYIGSSEGKLRALSLASGKRVWEFDGLGGFVETKPLVWQKRVFFGAWDSHFYALDASTGQLDWKWRGEQAAVLYSPAACWPVGAKGKVFLVAPDRRTTALDAATGRQLWRTGDYPVRESLGISENSSRLYVRTMNNFFYAFSTSTEKPEQLWERNAGFGYDINPAMLVEKQRVVFYGTKNGLLFALDGKTGVTKWQHKTGVTVLNTVVPLNGHRVLTSDLDGQVCLLEAK